MKHKLTALCDTGHKQEIVYGEGIGRDFVETQGGLLDGTSPLFAHSPIGTDSPIGKCGICGSPIHCSVSEVAE